MFFFSERELKKVLRYNLTRAAMDSYPSMRMQVILDSSFRPPGLSPYMGREEKESSGTGLVQHGRHYYFSSLSQRFDVNAVKTRKINKLRCT